MTRDKNAERLNINDEKYQLSAGEKPTARQVQQNEYMRDFADTCCNQYREAIILANENVIAALGDKSYCLVSSWLSIIQKLEDKLTAMSMRCVVIDMREKDGK